MGQTHLFLLNVERNGAYIDLFGNHIAKDIFYVLGILLIEITQ